MGTLAQHGHAVLFEYSQQALQRGVKFSALRVPLKAHTYANLPGDLGGLPGFVADALPDGWGLLLMDRVVRQAGRDPSTLTALDRAWPSSATVRWGPLAFKPSSDLPLRSQDKLTLQDLAAATPTVIADRDTPALRALALIGGSPQGARPKALVQFDAAHQTISTATDSAGTPWLLKFPAPGEHMEVCGIEVACAHLARSLGIDMPAVHLFKISAKPAAFGIDLSAACSTCCSTTETTTPRTLLCA